MIQEFTGLVEFIATAKAESFSEAARNLHVSVAHVSRRISHLEKRLSLRLFNRTTRQVALTESGRAFFLQCKPLIEELAQIQNVAHDREDTPTAPEGQIRISVAGRYSEQIITPLIARYCQHNPKVFCEIDFSSRNVDLIGENFDLAIRAGSLDDSPSLVARKIRTVPLITLANAKLAKSLRELKSPAQLDPALCWSHWGREWVFRKKDKVIRFEPRGQIASNNAEALVASALEGNGIIQVPAHYAQRSGGKLWPLFEEWQEPDGMTFHLVYPKQSFQPRRVRSLIDFIVENT